MKRKARVHQFDGVELFWGTGPGPRCRNIRQPRTTPNVNATPRTYFAPKDLWFIEDK